MNATHRTASLTVVVVAAIVLSGCSNKPPGCADAETLQTAKDLIVNDAKKSASGSADDQTGITGKFMDGVRVELSAIVDDGYRADAKKQSCKATMKVTAPTGQTLTGDIAYTTQKTLDGGKDQFLLEIDNAAQFSLQLAGAAQAYYTANRYLGTYSGTYACQGVAGATDGPRGPYSMPVSMSVTAGQEGAPSAASLERTTVGGGFEKLAGTAGAQFELSGTGQNSPSDTWVTSFHGTIQGDVASGSGFSRVPDGQILRNCKLDPTRGAAPTATTPLAVMTSSSAATDFSGEYKGVGESPVTAVIGQARPDGSYPVSLETWAVGGCGGTVEGSATRAANGSLGLTVARDGGRCGVALRLDAAGNLVSRESKGCESFHGASCSFNETMAKTK
jgi:hypothetical protein